MDEELLSRSQVAKALDVSPERVRQLTTSGLLPCTVTPLGRLYQRRDVDRVAFLPQRTLEQPGHPGLVLHYQHAHGITLRNESCRKAEGCR